MKLTILAIGCPLLLQSCANTSHLLVYQHLNFGINAGTNPQSGNLFARVGVRRDIGCVIPKVKANQNIDEATEPPVTGEAKENRAASAFVSSRVRVTNVFKAPEVAEVIATGSAAVRLASSRDALAPFLAPASEQ